MQELSALLERQLRRQTSGAASQSC
jgi:hypothetical protein